MTEEQARDRAYFLAKMEKCGIPDYMRGGLERYIMDRVEPGHFLMAVLRNDLRRAFERADDVNSACMRNYIVFLYTYSPSDCWGSPEKVAAWLKGEQEK